VDEKQTEPSIFLGTLAGYGVATALGVVFIVFLVLRAGKFEATGGFDVLIGAGAMGAISGYHITVRRRRARGIRGPLDEWSKFVVSRTAVWTGAVVLLGSFVVSLLILLVYNALSNKGA